ncbi:class I SAM-dependent methyltransferase [Azospirillum thermophilum]|uniref:Methyltransferase n=1 Tax=Azospirillum thermophilum TaxID=2202148 RepID=A0A2S2CYD1_9PROT|nr:class I SAM-dependent methyltransferase [Azospirillum thermophilum]AWK89287.1 hypothetical protein DEW08_23745 [Azospirillum thermophilum]
MQSWTEGYVGGIDYIRNFYREMSPSLIAFSLVLKGWRPPPGLAAGRFDYAELGCGYGLTSTVLAGACPQARFTALDFNPTHIAAARRLAGEAGLENTVFLEESFADYTRSDGPQFDVIALHGIWSWISAGNRAVLVELLRRKLRPGGVVFISYNTLPGNLVFQPLRRILTEHTAGGSGPLPARIAQAIDFASRAAALNAGWFATAEGIPSRIESLRRKPANYIAHEYLNSDWTAFYHADVARELAGAKLDFAAAAVALEQYDDLILSAQAQALAAEATDSAYAETLRDYLSNRSFRRDLFVKGAERLTESERTERLRDTRFALLSDPESLPEVVSTPIGRVPLSPTLYRPLGEALAEGPRSLRDLLRRPALAVHGEDQVLRALAMLSSLSLASPTLDAGTAEGGRSHADRCNAALMRDHRPGEGTTYLASPVLGTGVAVSWDEALFLLAARQGEEPAAFAWRHLSAQGVAFLRDGRRMETAEENLEELRQRHARFVERRLPILRTVGAA